MASLPAPREIVLACFAHLDSLLLSTAHVVRVFLLVFADQASLAAKIEEAHQLLQELEAAGILRRLSRPITAVVEKDREFCPWAGNGYLYGELELLIPLAKAREEVPPEDRGARAEELGPGALGSDRQGVASAEADDVTEEPRAPIAWAA